jgi:FkbM family methyltransferase
MRVAVVTPYYKETHEVLGTCIASVAAQSFRERRHILIADGHPNSLVASKDVSHIVLPTSHADNGNLARCVGAMAAVAEGFDAVAFLDADNWFRPDHLARMVDQHRRTGASVCTSGRTIHRLDGSLIGVDQHSDGEKFVDTSCLCIFRPAFDLLPLWGLMPHEFGPVCDRVMWQAIIARGICRSHSTEPTVAFRTQYALHYRNLGEVPPAGAKEEAETAAPGRQLETLPPPEKAALLLGLAAGDKWMRPTYAPSAQGRKVAVKAAATGRELRLSIPNDKGINFVFEEIFHKGCYKPVAGVAAPANILDVGANVGLSAAYFRLVYPQATLYCVEPDPSAYDYLKRNADMIGNCRTFNAGLYGATCTSKLHIGESSVRSSLAPLGGRSLRVLMLDARQFVADLPSVNFDLIKIDTEGAEVPIMLRLREVLEKTSVIHVEYHSDMDRRLIDAILGASHYAWRGSVISAHRGQLTYVLREAATPPADDPACYV